MDLKDKLNSLFSKLRGWLKLQFLAMLTLFCATVGHTAVVQVEEFAFNGLGSSNNATADIFDLSLDYNSDYISSWLNDVRESNQNCQPYISVLNHFNPCVPSLFESDLIMDSENRNPFYNTTDTEHES